MKLLFLSLVLSSLVISGCSAVKDDKTIGWSVQKLYDEAKDAMQSGSYITARKHYERISSRYPFGRYAQQTHLDLIQLNYKDKEYDKAIAQADKFIQLYPTHPYVDYARYMKGVISYSRDISIIDKIVPTNIAQSDQSLMEQAFEDFNQLVEISPAGEYTEDAKLRMVFLRNVTAEHEIYVAEYYLRRGAYLAAANRGKYVLENYLKTPSVALALGTMTRAYKELGMQDLSDDAFKVLKLNFSSEIATNERLKFILEGDIKQKKGFWASIRQSLIN